MSSSHKLLKFETLTNRTEKQCREALASNVRLLMDSHDWTQQDVADKTGLGQRTISNVINPESGISPTLRTLVALGLAFNTVPWSLIVPGMISPQRHKAS